MLKEDLIESHQRIKPYIHNTPIFSSQLIRASSKNLPY